MAKKETTPKVETVEVVAYDLQKRGFFSIERTRTLAALPIGHGPEHAGRYLGLERLADLCAAVTIHLDGEIAGRGQQLVVMVGIPHERHA